VKPRMMRYAKIGLMLAVVVAVALVSAFWATTFEPRNPPFEPRPFPFERIRGDWELFYIIQTVVSSINVVLLVFLLVTYVGLYQKTGSEFTVGLIIFSLTLLLYALVSNPLVHWLFGFRAVGLGPFAMLPDVFTSLALVVLLYLTFKY
jgi:hypothetical protein